MTQGIEFFIPAGRADTGAALREYTTRRLSFALRRFEDRVRHITVRFIDLNGPRRGVDSRCSMALDLVGGRRIVVEATTPWPFASVARAAGRLNGAVRKEVGRASSHRRIRHVDGTPRVGG
jgi:putative sigma-54 modulation protein